MSILPANGNSSISHTLATSSHSSEAHPVPALPEQLASCVLYDDDHLSTSQADGIRPIASQPEMLPSLHRLSLLGVDLLCDALFVQGYACGRKHCRGYGASRLLLTDNEFKHLMVPLCPFSLGDARSQNWRRGFILGWVFRWAEQHVSAAPSTHPTSSAGKEDHAHV